MGVSLLRYPLFIVVILMMFAGGWAALQRTGHERQRLGMVFDRLQ